MRYDPQGYGVDGSLEHQLRENAAFLAHFDPGTRGKCFKFPRLEICYPCWVFFAAEILKLVTSPSDEQINEKCPRLLLTSFNVDTP